MTIEDYKNLLSRLKNEDERKLAKILMENTFPEMVDYFQGKVEELKEGMLAENVSNINRWEVAMTICDKNRLGALEEGLYPMKKSDLEKKESVKQGRYVFFPVYLEAADADIKERLTYGYSGKLTVENQEFEVPVHLEKNDSYLSIIENLKQSFLQSGIRWLPLNLAYLEKFYYFVAKLPEEATVQEDASEFSLAVSQFDLAVREGIIPVWNVEHVSIAASDFPVIQENKMLYQYEFRVESNVEYIPDHQKPIDGECVRRGNSLLVITQENERSKFAFWKITRRDWAEVGSDRLILTNGVKNILIGQRPDHAIVHSQYELERAIHQLSVSRHLKFLGFQVRPQDYYLHCESAYDVLTAREDGDVIPQCRQRDYLELSFENAGLDAYLFRNVVWFVADMIQTEFREFRVNAVPCDEK